MSDCCVPADRLIQTLLVNVPGVTTDLLNLQLFNVMDEFFRRTNAWRYEVDIDMREGELEYALNTPVDTVVVRTLGVTHQGMPVMSTSSVTGSSSSSVGRLDSTTVFPDGDSAIDPAISDLAGDLFSYAIYRPQYISITGTPDAEGRKFPLKATLALSLAPRCMECECGDWAVEEWMWNSFFACWLDGALGRLYIMPAKPWSNPAVGVQHAKRFRNQMAYHKQEAVRGFSYAVQTWHYPRRGWV